MTFVNFSKQKWSRISVCRLGWIKMYVNFSLGITIGVGAQSTLAARHFCPKIYIWNMYKVLKFYITFARKMNKMSQFYIIFAPKNFSRFFFWGGEAREPLPPSPTAMGITLCQHHSPRLWGNLLWSVLGKVLISLTLNHHGNGHKPLLLNTSRDLKELHSVSAFWWTGLVKIKRIRTNVYRYY